MSDKVGADVLPGIYPPRICAMVRGTIWPKPKRAAGCGTKYLSMVDDHLRHDDDKPTIGQILCQEHNRVLAEYLLRGMDKPIGVSSFELTRALPETLQTSLPSIETIEWELGELPEEPSE